MECFKGHADVDIATLLATTRNDGAIGEYRLDLAKRAMVLRSVWVWAS